MRNKVNFVNARNLKTARENVGYSTIKMTQKILGKGMRVDKILEWENGRDKPTWNQLHTIANVYGVNTFLLTGKELIPSSRNIFDFRKTRSLTNNPDSDLFKFIDFLLQRQRYLNATMLKEELGSNKLVGSGIAYQTNPKKMAEFIAGKINYNHPRNNHLKTLVTLLENNKVFVMKTLSYWRNITVNDMRGVYLKDNYAPIIALNRKDSKTAQLFTLAHEITHLFLDKEGISNISFRDRTTNQIEVFCNKVAANLLMPEDKLEKIKDMQEIDSLAKRFGVSRLMTFYRLKNLGLLNAIADLSQLEQSIKRESEKKSSDNPTGGNYNNNMKDSNGGLFNNFISSLYFNQKINAAEACKILKVSIDKVV